MGIVLLRQSVEEIETFAPSSACDIRDIVKQNAMRDSLAESSRVPPVQPSERRN